MHMYTQLDDFYSQSFVWIKIKRLRIFKNEKGWGVVRYEWAFLKASFIILTNQEFSGYRLTASWRFFILTLPPFEGWLRKQKGGLNVFWNSFLIILVSGLFWLFKGINPIRYAFKLKNEFILQYQFCMFIYKLTFIATEARLMSSFAA